MSTSYSPLGLSAFETLQADREPWLAEAFVPPRVYNLIAGQNSTIIYGATGAGKSTVLQMLKKQYLVESHDQPHLLIVEWKPVPQESQEQVDPARWQLEITKQLSLTLLELLSANDTLRDLAPNWAISIFDAFIRTYPPDWMEMTLFRLSGQATDAGQIWLKSFETIQPDQAKLQYSMTHLPRLRSIEHLLSSLQTIQMAGIWVLIDGLERWGRFGKAQLDDQIRDFLSSLIWFEQPGLLFKIVIPDDWKPMIRKSGAIQRRRLDEFTLRWRREDLETIASRRLTLATGYPEFDLGHLCSDCGLEQWLWQYGGKTPRGWLLLLRDIYNEYHNQNNDPISSEQWQKLRRQIMPPLRIAEDSRVLIGHHEITGLPERSSAMLEYLYKKRRLCSRQELYYRAYRGYARVPIDHKDNLWEYPDDWRGIIDTALWRLRKAIEPDPNNPIFLINIRGRGIKLEHTE